MIKVLFVCHANSCRSPLAEALFHHKLSKLNLLHRVQVDSAGVSQVREGREPDREILDLLKDIGIQDYTHLARVVRFEDYYTQNYILASDMNVLKRIKQANPVDGKAVLTLMMDYVTNAETTDIEDPCQTGRFDYAYQLIDVSTDALLDAIFQEIGA